MTAAQVASGLVDAYFARFGIRPTWIGMPQRAHDEMWAQATGGRQPVATQMRLLQTRYGPLEVRAGMQWAVGIDQGAVVLEGPLNEEVNPPA